MKLKDFLKSFYGNNAIALSVSNCKEHDGLYHSFYENALMDIPKECLEYKVLAIYPWDSNYIGVTCRSN